jgi:predicted ATPase/class 3 adenylate cyclase
MDVNIERWLADLGLEKYAAVFAEHEVDLPVLADLTDSDLQTLGIPLGPRKKILKAIAEGGLSRTPSAAPPPATPPSFPAERRQLTVMFCDLVGSTALSAQLDPEDLRELVRAYQAACGDVVQRFEGYIAQYLGDGLLIYFGWPQAHEDDAPRAVHAALGMLAAMDALNQRLPTAAASVRLTVRIGVHTGQVVVGEVGRDARHERLAIGETPNVAARIEGVAQPGTVAVSDATYQLVHGHFDCVPLGAHALRGVAQPMPVYRVEGRRAASNLSEASEAVTQLVGREPEVAFLLELWHRATTGRGQVVILNGEAGIGKSRLVGVLKSHLADVPCTRIECRSSPYDRNTAFYPVIDMLQRRLAWQADDTPEQRLDQLERELAPFPLPLGESVPLFAALLSLSCPETRYPPRAGSPQQQRQRTLDSIVSMLSALAQQQPVLLIVEDLHWTDPSTLDLLGLLIDHAGDQAIYVLLTCRPTWEPPWPRRSWVTQLTLQRLSDDEIHRLVEHVTAGHRLPADVRRQIVDKSDGVPLYVEEITKAVLEAEPSARPGEPDSRAGASMAIPATLQDALMARLDQLGTAKIVAQHAAVIGRQFAYPVLSAVGDIPDATLQHELSRLVDSGLVYQRGRPPDAEYVFKHALIQDIAYRSLLRGTRQECHERIARTLLAQFPEMAGSRAELLAHHYTEAGQDAIAIGFWHRAGEHALRNSSYVEASRHLSRGLELAGKQPATRDNLSQTLAMQAALATALLPTKGYGSIEVAEAYGRAQELCERLGDTAHLFPVLYGQWASQVHRADHEATLELGEQTLARAREVADAGARLVSERALGQSLLFTGRLERARGHLEAAVASYDLGEHGGLALQYGLDLRTAGLSHLVVTYWLLGRPDKAAACSAHALAHAEAVRHENSLAHTLVHAGTFFEQFRDNPAGVRAHARRLATLAEEGGFRMFLAWCRVLEGWAGFELGEQDQGLAVMRAGIADAKASGSVLYQSYFLTLLAQCYDKVDEAVRARQAIDEALQFVDGYGERWYAAEAYRVKGTLLLREEGHEGEAEELFQAALAVAHEQCARALALRSALSLAALWRKRGRLDEARSLVTPIYHGFAEGLQAPELGAARALIHDP